MTTTATPVHSPLRHLPFSRDSDSPRRVSLWLTWGLVLVGLAGLYGPLLYRLAQAWERDGNYAHGWLVPCISAWLVWRQRACWLRSEQTHPALGAAEVAAGGMVHLAAAVVGWPLLDYVGVLLVGRGVALVLCGEPAARRLWFPLAFLFFMFPLPVAWTGALAVTLQDWVSWLASGVLGLMWVCHREGNSLWLAGLDVPLTVAEECSGLRQAVAFLAMAVLVGHLGHRTGSSRLILVALSLPCAVFANLLRVVGLAMAVRLGGPGWLHGAWHDVPALLTLPVGLLCLLGLAHGLPRASEVAAVPTEPGPETPDRAWGGVGVAAVLGGLVLLQIGLDRHLTAVPTVTYPTLPAFIEAFPVRLHTPPAPVWQGVERPDRADVAKTIPFADGFLTRYYAPADGGVAASVYAVFSQRGEDRLHHPEICVRDVGGATEVAGAAAVVRLSPDEERFARRFAFRTSTTRQTTVYYWHYSLPATDPARPLSLLQRIHHRWSQRPPSITVQVATDAAGPSLVRVEQELLPQLDAVFRGQLPAGTRVGHDRLPIRFTGS